MSANQVYPLQTGERVVSIRAAEANDLAAIARIHCGAFPAAFLTALGAGFLRVYYRLILDDPGGILLVREGGGEVAGFVAGFADPAAFYRRLKGARAQMAASLAWALMKNPSLAGRIFYHFRSLQSGARRVHSGECELSSLAVRPGAWGQGTGRELVRAFLDEAWRRGGRRVYLTTEADGNARVNRFYQQLGFELRARFEQYRGRLLNEYVFFQDGQ